MSDLFRLHLPNQLGFGPLYLAIDFTTRSPKTRVVLGPGIDGVTGYTPISGWPITKGILRGPQIVWIQTQFQDGSTGGFGGLAADATAAINALRPQKTFAATWNVGDETFNGVPIDPPLISSLDGAGLLLGDLCHIVLTDENIPEGGGFLTITIPVEEIFGFHSLFAFVYGAPTGIPITAGTEALEYVGDYDSASVDSIIANVASYFKFDPNTGRDLPIT